MFGDSIHKTIEYIHSQVSQNQSIPLIKNITDYFISRLETQPLSKSEFKYFKKRGEDNLSEWLSLNKNKFKKSDLSEHDFSGEQIILEGAKLTGKIDVVRELIKNDVAVIDYKTSAPLHGWTGLNTSSAIRANSYKNQLLFYKLLVDNSVGFRKKAKATKGIIEFTTPDDDNNFIELEYDYSGNDLERLTNLIKIVWQKIINLDLPDTEKYPSTIKGIKSFEDDLLEGNI
jgi:DNA helicase-2/ATP-dependent DNA helicase PcrA